MDSEAIVKQLDWAISKIEKAFDTPAHRWLKRVSKKLEKLQPEHANKAESVMRVTAGDASVSFGPKPSRSAAPTGTQERKTA